MPLSQLFKLAILMLIVVRLQYKGIVLLLGTLIYLSFYLLHLALTTDEYKEPILMFSKFLSLFYLYFYFRFSFRCFPAKSALYGRKALLIAWIVFACNVMLGLAGYGVSTYGGADEEDIDMGVKGFFFAGNELGGIMAVLAPFMFYLILAKLSGLKSVLAYMVVIAIGTLVGTKTAILATWLSAIVIPLLYLPPRKRLGLILVLIAAIGLSIPYVINLISESSIGAVERWSYFYDSGGVERLIFSGRDEYWNLLSREFYKSDFPIQLFGMGINGKIVERDHLDTLLIFGYLGFFLITSFFLYLLFYAYRYRHNNSLMKVVIFSDLLVLGISYIAGHVWFSAMASVYIALLNAFTFLHFDGVLFGRPVKRSKSINIIKE